MEKTDILIGNKEYTVLLALTEEEKVTGLSKVTSLPKDEGMLFVYDEPLDLIFTMEDTSIDLDIIFMNEGGEVISVYSVRAGSDEEIAEEGAQYVLEVNIGSGIEVGDELEEIDDLEEEEKEKVNNMLVLDANGDVQYRLEGGERIISRILTKQLIHLALKAYKSDSDLDYRAVGRKIFKIFDGQDARDPEYVLKEVKE